MAGPGRNRVQAARREAQSSTAQSIASSQATVTPNQPRKEHVEAQAAPSYSGGFDGPPDARSNPGTGTSPFPAGTGRDPAREPQPFLSTHLELPAAAYRDPSKQVSISLCLFPLWPSLYCHKIFGEIHKCGSLVLFTRSFLPRTKLGIDDVS